MTRQLEERIATLIRGELEVEVPGTEVDLIDAGLLDSLALVSLIALAYWDDHRDPTIKAQLERQGKQAEKFLSTPFIPQAVGLQAKVVAPSAPAPAT